MRRIRTCRDDDGFTLVETLAAMLVFSIVTLGVLPLLATSLRGATLSRSYTVGKNAALQAMERARGLPYFISYAAQNKKVDLLDLYFPVYEADGEYVVTCTSPPPSEPACPRDIPSGYTLTFAARFVQPGPIENGKETHTLVMPATDYAWNSTSAQDQPPSKLLELTITASWKVAGTTRSTRLKTLIGDRKFGQTKIRGVGRVDYILQVLTQFVDPAGRTSELIAVAGSAESRIESRLIASADQFASAADIRLVELPTATDPAGRDLRVVQGATTLLHAPPDSTSTGSRQSTLDGAAVATYPLTITHPSFVPELEIAGLDLSETRDLSASTATELPRSAGYIDFQPGGGQGTKPHLWVKNQADTGNDTVLKLDPNRRLLSLRAVPGGSDTITGGTTATTTALTPSSSRKVETTATASFRDFRLMPTTFAAGGVVKIDAFSSSTSCTSTASATASGAATWSATLSYWAADDDDADDDDGDGDAELDDPGYKTIQLSSAQGVDPLVAIKGANPLVYKGALPAEDIYLFDDPAALKEGYLTDWSSHTGGATKDAEGRSTTAIIDGAIRIDTAPTNALLPESGLNVSVGKLSCEAVDLR